MGAAGFIHSTAIVPAPPASGKKLSKRRLARASVRCFRLDDIRGGSVSAGVRHVGTGAMATIAREPSGAWRSRTAPQPLLLRRPPPDGLRLRLPRVRRKPRHSRRRAHRSRHPDRRQQDRGRLLPQPALADGPVLGACILDIERRRETGARRGFAAPAEVPRPPPARPRHRRWGLYKLAPPG